jgi:alpha-galactosidase
MAGFSKIVFVGAGSAAFGLSLCRDIFTSDGLEGCTLALVDTDREALARMAKVAAAMRRATGRRIAVEHTVERCAALDGADFVVNAAAIERNRLWRLDFEIPRKYGIRQTLGENGGPGGLFFTMRTLPLIFDIARDVEAICPDALFINFSNPENRIALALGKYSRMRALGLCHGIFMARWAVAKVLDLREDAVDVWGAGLNHFQWLLHIRDRMSGKDLYPLLRARERGYDAGFAPLTRRLFRAFGHWVTCSDDHLGEYLPYGWEAGGQGYDFAADERGRAEIVAAMDEVVSGAPVPSRWLTPSGERAVEVIAAVRHNRKKFIESGIVYNQGVIPNLPADLGVEVPVLADAAGIHPISLGPLPEPIAKLLSVQAGVQQLAVEAAMRASKELALECLLVDPVIDSTAAAAKILEELWEINAPYIRPSL